MVKPNILKEDSKIIPGEKYLLIETFNFCKDGVCQRPQLNEAGMTPTRKDGSLYLRGVIQRADAENGNGRVYPRSILEREIKSYERLIREKRAYGCLDHPDDSVVNLEKVSHMITEVWWQDNEVWGTLKVMTSTPMGKIVEGLLNDGGTIGLSSRGLGSVTEQRNGILKVESDFQLICFDIVSEPSTHGAFMRPVNELKNYTPDLSVLAENKKFNIYTKNDRISRAINDFLSE